MPSGTSKGLQLHRQPDNTFSLHDAQVYHKQLAKLQDQHFKVTEKAKLAQLQFDLSSNKRKYEELTKQEKELLRRANNCEREALAFAEDCAKKLYDKQTLHQKKLFADKQLALQKDLATQLANEAAAAQAAVNAAKTDDERSDANKRLLEAQQAQASLLTHMTETSKGTLKYEQQLRDAELSKLSTAEKLKAIRKAQQEADSKYQEEQSKLQQEIVAAQVAQQNLDPESAEFKELQKRIEELTSALHDSEDAQRETSAELSDAFEAAKKPDKEQKKKDKEAVAKEHAAAQSDQEALNAQKKAEVAYKFTTKAGLKETGKEIGGKAVQAVANFAADMSKAIDDNIKTFYAYQSSLEARLQGSQESYQDSLKNVAKNVGLSGLVSQKEVVNNIKTLVEAGVAYNVDLRAFLQTVKDDIATTFDAFDSNLLRLIRIQQADTTAARLGMEADLTRLFNEYFSDTSYLSNALDSVAGSILDASSQLTRDSSLEFEYAVQKWLGALYSVGVSDNAVNSIAQGLNYLGTGNVEGLTGNEALMQLLAMSAARSGHNIGDILTGGLDAKITNDLMQGMVEYLKEIANNTHENQVTKSAYANLYGLTTTDINSINNLSPSDISNLFDQSLTYAGAINELNNQFGQISNRVHLSQVLDTVYENAVLSAATGIGNSAGLYTTWLVTNLVEKLTGGIELPFVNVMGFGVDLNTTVTGLIKTGIAGAGLMSSLLSSMAGGNLFGNLSTDGWGWDEYTSRGGNRKAITSGISKGMSASDTLGSSTSSSSSSDMQNSALTDATSDAESTSEITNANHTPADDDIYTKIYNVLGGEDVDQTILKSTLEIVELLQPERLFRTATDGLDELLSGNRIFYVSLVDLLPAAAENFSVGYGGSTTYNSDVRHTASSAITTTEGSVTDILAAQIANNALATSSAIETLAATNLYAQSGKSDSLITAGGMKVAVSELSPEIKQFLTTAITAAAQEIVKAQYGDTEEDAESPVVNAIRVALSDGVQIKHEALDSMSMMNPFK